MRTVGPDPGSGDTSSCDLTRELRHFGTERLVAYVAIALVLLAPLRAAAQDVTESALKATYIYNFAKFTSWPADLIPPANPLVMCVLGDDAVSAALERVVKDRKLGGHSMSVSTVQLTTPAAPQRLCHVLYVSGVTSSQAASVIAGLRDASVLTISDIDGFCDVGGIAEFFFDRGRLRFTIHAPSLNRSRLRISSTLQALGTQQ